VVCGKVKCPSCGYENPASPQGRGEVRLSDLGPGSSGVVSRLDFHNKGLRKMLALGLLPGTRLSVRRRSPCCVLRAGNTELALDRDVAQGIHVYLDEDLPEGQEVTVAITD
jgi:Fe2+ transport system protein FeoA